MNQKKPVECDSHYDDIHDWHLIANFSNVDLIKRTELGGTSETTLPVKIFVCHKCDLVKFFHNKP